jgi:hypothetical protein
VFNIHWIEKAGFGYKKIEIFLKHVFFQSEATFCHSYSLTNAITQNSRFEMDVAFTG